MSTATNTPAATPVRPPAESTPTPSPVDFPTERFGSPDFALMRDASARYTPRTVPRRRRWPLLVIGASAGTATWSGWVGLGELVGFGQVNPLPGIWDAFVINTAITLPIGVEAYAIFALAVATSAADLPRRARRYAWASAAAALILGMAGQVAYHLMVAAGPEPVAPQWLVAAVSCLPVLVLGAASLLWHLAADHHTGPGEHTDEGEGTTTAAPNLPPELVQAMRVPVRVAPADQDARGLVLGPDAPAPRVQTVPRGTPVRAQTKTAAATARKVARLREQHPDWTVARIAERVGVSERTARRHLNTTPATGTAVSSAASPASSAEDPAEDPADPAPQAPTDEGAQRAA